MTRQEFEQRTGFEPTAKEYEAIEEVYMNSELDKDAFCKAWVKMNSKRVAKQKAERKAAENLAKNLFENMVCITEWQGEQLIRNYEDNTNWLASFHGEEVKEDVRAIIAEMKVREYRVFYPICEREWGKAIEIHLYPRQ